MSEKIVLFYSGDLAGRNIAGKLRDMGVTANIIEYRTEILYMKNMGIKPEVCVVASRHKSESGIPVLTTHSPGNFGNADFGGNSRELSIAPALYLRESLIYLEEGMEKRRLPYEVSLEATHHGPTSLEFPVLFMEVGSSHNEWGDMGACSAVAEAVYKLMESEPEDKTPTIAFGGGHYCRKFSQIREYAIGHICPRHSLHNLDTLMIEQMMLKTKPRPEIALVEKRGMGDEKQRVLCLLGETELEIVKI